MENEVELAARTERIGRQLLPHVGMLLLLPDSDASPKDIISNGTASFIDTGQRQVIVTCSHVVNGFLEWLPGYQGNIKTGLA
jgi:hypothetical protein